jgi:hypothetical protein
MIIKPCHRYRCRVSTPGPGHAGHILMAMDTYAARLSLVVRLRAAVSEDARWVAAPSLKAGCRPRPAAGMTHGLRTSRSGQPHGPDPAAFLACSRDALRDMTQHRAGR